MGSHKLHIAGKSVGLHGSLIAATHRLSELSRYDPYIIVTTF